jgi:ATP-binding cassette, subfamily B, bacterial
LRNIGWQVRNLQRAANELDDLVEIGATPPQVRDLPGARDLLPRDGEIRFDGVWFCYANQPEPVLADFSLHIAAGEKVALVGESGAGKTTLVKLLQRLYDVDRGHITIDGQDIARVTQESLRRSIALVPQEPILFHRSLLENIRYGRPDASRADVIAAARKAHAHEFIERLADGFDTVVGERGIKLSGGERQRVAIARAILADAPILVLDEATSSLDSITEHYIQDAIAHLMEGRTAILIAHRLSTVRQCDRILVFDHGKLVEQGTHDALMARPRGIYRGLFDMQSLGFVDAASAR